jgi:hypothetical protein
MWREFENWEDFPTTPAARYSRPSSHPVIEAINRAAERFLGVLMVCVPFVYAAFFLAFLAVAFGIIS